MVKKTTVVAISGGVDSLKASLLLKERGYDVTGLYMIMSPSNGGIQLKRVLRLGKFFHIPIVIVDIRKEFQEKVITPFIEAYKKGVTPNPCVICNPEIKFFYLHLISKKLAPEAIIATGHYARVVKPEENPYGRYGIKRHKDPSKDQSYFLYGLSQEVLSSLEFPLEAQTKKEVIEWAKSLGIESLLSIESQEVCFIPSNDYPGFIEANTKIAPGPIMDREGNLLGWHKGIHRYTIGQRRGIGIPSNAPYYVVKIDAQKNTLYVGRREELYSRRCFVSNVKWLSIEKPTKPLRVEVKIRNQHIPASATVEAVEDEKAYICFDEPQIAITPGQSAVFYEKDLLLGGGIIERAEEAD